MRELSNEKDNFCITNGDMHCTHNDWCDAEIAIRYEQYDEEIKINPNKN